MVRMVEFLGLLLVILCLCFNVTLLPVWRGLRWQNCHRGAIRRRRGRLAERFFGPWRRLRIRLEFILRVLRGSGCEQQACSKQHAGVDHSA